MHLFERLLSLVCGFLFAGIAVVASIFEVSIRPGLNPADASIDVRIIGVGIVCAIGYWLLVASDQHTQKLNRQLYWLSPLTISLPLALFGYLFIVTNVHFLRLLCGLAFLVSIWLCGRAILVSRVERRSRPHSNGDLPLK
jgi:hypothetical protein